VRSLRTIWVVEDYYCGELLAIHMLPSRRSARERVAYARRYDSGNPWRNQWKYRVRRYERGKA
jgi:hypothetical protein